eukprot:scaffold2898_cov68-Phaeocystis_antarctica.AAC.2
MPLYHRTHRLPGPVVVSLKFRRRGRRPQTQTAPDTDAGSGGGAPGSGAQCGDGGRRDTCLIARLITCLSWRRRRRRPPGERSVACAAATVASAATGAISTATAGGAPAAWSVPAAWSTSATSNAATSAAASSVWKTSAGGRGVSTVWSSSKALCAKKSPNSNHIFCSRPRMGAEDFRSFSILSKAPAHLLKNSDTSAADATEPKACIPGAILGSISTALIKWVPSATAASTVCWLGIVGSIYPICVGWIAGRWIAGRAHILRGLVKRPNVHFSTFHITFVDIYSSILCI